MVKYLIILLDDSSVSFCHYSNSTSKRIITLNDLRSGIEFGMKQNLRIQFVYPSYELPDEYLALIDSVDHSKIMPSELGNDADITVLNSISESDDIIVSKNHSYLLRLSKDDFFNKQTIIKKILRQAGRVNFVINDIDSFTIDDINQYCTVLQDLVDEFVLLFRNENRLPQTNLLTDRMLLSSMNNCGAGDSSVTLAPDGCFYVCPAFYYDCIADGSETSQYDISHRGYCIGTLSSGLDILNAHLYKLSHAPICRKCDAYQCKRCIWMNRRNTYELNTPGHEQCVVSHIERNAARCLVLRLQNEFGAFTNISIPEINYDDPICLNTNYQN